MPSTFFGLNIASSGLRAANAALNTTANNISNADTEGYSRQMVVQQAYDALRTFTTYGCAGAGVDTIAIERIRNDFYDTKYWKNNTLAGEYDVKQEYYQQIEAYFTDDSTTDGFKTIFNEMVNALAEIAKQAGSTTTKAQFIGSAGSLAEYFNGLAGNLQDLQKSLNQEVKVKADEINTIASELATLNKQINVIEMSTGGTANELRDRRTLLIDQLSAIVDVEVIESPVYDMNNMDRDTGGTNFIVKIAGGQLLVNTGEYRTLECTARKPNEKVNQTDIDGLYDLRWTDGQECDLYNNVVGGELKGLIQMRDGNSGENFQGEVISVTGNEVKVEVTKEYLTNLNKTNLSEAGTIRLGRQEFYYDGWTFQEDYNAATGESKYYYIFNIDEEASDAPVNSGLSGQSAFTGQEVKYQGIPYYMQQMNEWIRSFSQAVNDILGAGFTSGGDPGCDLFTGNDSMSNTQFTFAGSTRYDKWTAGGMVKSSESSYYKLTAMNFDVLKALESNADFLAVKNGQSNGVDEYGTITDITNMLGDKDAMSFRNCTAGEFLICMMSDISLNANSANTFYKNYSNIAATIDNQRISISGVDSDEEALNLVKYQNTFNLASKMVQTLTEMYDRLILQTGV